MKNSTLCYIEKEGKTLFLHRNKKENDVHKDMFIGLGGKMESGESPEECITREVKEESGLDIISPKLKGILTFPKFKNDEDWYVFLFTASEFTGQLQECNEGELLWIENDEILNLNLSEGDKLFLNWMRSYNFFSAKIVYENKKLIDYNLVIYS
ncbi:MAG: NUDIX domain-containing protein [Clostridiaceae bacterium]